MANRQPHFSRVKRLLNNDSEKARLWFCTENPLLGNVSPDQMLSGGYRQRLRLRKFIDEAVRLSSHQNGQDQEQVG